VKKYADMHKDMPVAELMHVPARVIFDEAKYKPK
jgi:hypothetical protein